MKTLFGVVVLIAAASALSGCLPPVKGADRVVDADAAKVANCTFIKDVSARPGDRGGTKSALGSAMDAARQEASASGATDIVWTPITDANAAIVTGKAYRCTK